MEDPLIMRFEFHPGPTRGFDSVISSCPPALFVDIPGHGEALNMRLAVNFLRELADFGAKAVNELCARADFFITSDEETIRVRGNMHDCPQCRAGTDQALTHLRENPEARFVVGQLFWLDQEAAGVQG